MKKHGCQRITRQLVMVCVMSGEFMATMVENPPRTWCGEYCASAGEYEQGAAAEQQDLNGKGHWQGMAVAVGW